jgi:hypothetical protein
MDVLGLAEFDEVVAEAAAKMVATLEEFNQRQANPEGAVCSAKDLRGEFAEYFRKLLSAKIEVADGLQAEAGEEATESSEAAEETVALPGRKFFRSSES